METLILVRNFFEDTGRHVRGFLLFQKLGPEITLKYSLKSIFHKSNLKTLIQVEKISITE